MSKTNIDYSYSINHTGGKQFGLRTINIYSDYYHRRVQWVVSQMQRQELHDMCEAKMGENCVRNAVFHALPTYIFIFFNSCFASIKVARSQHVRSPLDRQQHSFFLDIDAFRLAPKLLPVGFSAEHSALHALTAHVLFLPCLTCLLINDMFASCARSRLVGMINRTHSSYVQSLYGTKTTNYYGTMGNRTNCRTS